MIALKGFGGAEKVGAAKNIQTAIIQKYKVEDRMEDYVIREVDGLILPFTTQVAFNGEDKEKQTRTFDKITINTEIYPELFVLSE